MQNIQDTINSRLSGQFPGLELQMQVQRINVSVVEGTEADLEVDLEQIFNEADTGLAPPQALEDEPKDQAEDGIRDFCLSRGLGDVYKRQFKSRSTADFQGSSLALNCRCRCNAST